MRILADFPEPRADRYASALLHDDPHTRVVAFMLTPGQAVPPHDSASMVLVIVTQGSALFTGRDAEATLCVGDAAVYAPGEVHGIVAGVEGVRFYAVIAPRPGG